MNDCAADAGDVVVIGGGPAGATCATLLARRGHRVLLLERDKFPRHRIGESLLPATVHGICSLLGVKEEIEAAGFVKKRGGTFRWGKNPEPWTFTFDSQSKVTGDGRFGYAYQVERAKFDAILLNNAARSGVDVRTGATVTDLLLAGDRISGVAYVDADGVERSVTARYVVNGAGGTAPFHRYLSPRQLSEFFRNIAIYGYFANGKRLPGERAGNVLSCAFDEGWFWYIPLSAQLTSVGAVVRVEEFEKVSPGRLDEALRRYIQRCPMVCDLLSEARRVTEGMYGEVRVVRDYSYYAERYWGPGLVSIGDAACFIDPVFSSGVHLATYSALLAARSINSFFEDPGGEAAYFGEFERRYRREFAIFYQFLAGFYHMHEDEQSYFWRARKLLGETDEPARDTFVRLVAGLSASNEPMFRDAEAFSQTARRTATVIEFGAATSLGIKTEPVDPGNLDAARLQLAKNFRERISLLRQGAEQPPESNPLFTDGLVAAADGLSWRPPQPRPGVRQHQE